MTCKIIAALSFLCLTGCAGFYLPNRGDNVDLASLGGKKPDCAVRVAVQSPEAYFYGPEPVLHYLKAIDAVTVVSPDRNPDLRLMVKINHHGSASQALMPLTFLTLGIFPTYYIETKDLKVEVWKGERLLKEYEYERNFHVVAGLFGLLLSPMANASGNEGSGFSGGYEYIMGRQFVYDFSNSDLIHCGAAANYEQ